MAAERRPLDDVAAAILDGASVNWDAVESSSPEGDRELIPYLRLVARIAEAHRGEATADPPGSLDERTPLRLVPRGLGVEATRPPETWGHLRVLERVGAGAFGDVYRAWDTRLDREVALKLLPPDEPSSNGSTVIAEGSLLARVRHPNVVAVYGAERYGGRVGLWMEFISGRRIDEVLAERGALSAHEASLVGLEICRALSAVHRAGLLHRDVKAQNAMREDGGRVVLMDFGTGTLHAEGARGGQPDLAGTPLYLAPEVFAGRPASVQSDIYSVGVLLFHMVTKSFPVTAASVRDLRDAHGEGRRRFLRDERPDLPDEFVALVERAIAPDPAQRFQSAGAMEIALARILAEGVSRPAAPIRWRTVGAVAAATLLVAAFALIPRTWRDRLLPKTGAKPPDDRARAAGYAASTVQVRKVPLPAGLLVGRPSADGRFFSLSDMDGNLALLELANGNVRRLTTDASLEHGTDQHAEFSTISSDGRFVAYTWWALDGKYELRVIGVDGGRPRLLVRSDAVDLPRPLEWSRDGKSVLAILTAADGDNQLVFVSVADGGTRLIKEFGPLGPRHASLSPDGEFVVYDAPQVGGSAYRDLFIVRADGSDARALVQHPATDIEPVWTPDGRRVLFASDRSGAMDLWSVPVAAGAAQGEPEVAHRNIGRLAALGLTEGGTYYYHLLVGAVEVYSAELFPDGRMSKPAPLGSTHSGANISSVWSPDGRRVAYASRRGLVRFEPGSTALVVRDLQTGEERELVPLMNGLLVRSWSPDGQRILVSGDAPGGKTGIFSVDADTGETTAMVLADRPSRQTDLGRGSWTPDGQGIIYRNDARRSLLLRDLHTGRDEVALDFRKEGIEAVNSHVAGRGYGISRDGQGFAFTAWLHEDAKSATSLRVKFAGGVASELVKAVEPESLIFQDWMPDGTALLFTKSRPGQPASLWRVSARGGDPQPLGLTMPGLRDVSVHPDGRRLTFTAGWPTLEVWVVENFLPELSRP
jgi:serine/threonine-protein kinase